MAAAASRNTLTATPHSPKNPQNAVTTAGFEEIGAWPQTSAQAF
jgi:hypothetical protein